MGGSLPSSLVDLDWRWAGTLTFSSSSSQPAGRVTHLYILLSASNPGGLLWCRVKVARLLDKGPVHRG